MAADRGALLLELTEALAGALSAEDVATAVVGRAVPALDAVGGALLVADGDSLVVAGPAGYPGDLIQRFGRLPLEPGLPVVDAVLADEAVLLRDEAEVAARYPALVGAGLAGDHGMAALPLSVGAAVLGALTFSWAGPRRFDDDDARLLRAVARQAAQALDRAQLFRREQAARAAAAGAAARAGLLADVGAALDRSMRVEDRFREVGAVLVPRFADLSAVDLLLPAGLVGVHVVHRDPGAAARVAEARGRSDPASAHHVLRTGEPLLLAEMVYAPVEGEAASLRDVLTDLGASSCILVPLTAHGTRLGVLSAVRCGGAPFDEADVDVAVELGRRIGLSIDNARLFEAQRDIATLLQRSLLPQHLPEVPGLAVAASYHSATDGTSAGGDWYDVVELADAGAVGLAVGDVVGHGTEAAAVMGQLRSALRAIAYDAPGPGDVLARVDRFAAATPGAASSTVCYVELEPATGRIRYACAGHPYPLVVTADGFCRYLARGRSPVLGFGLGVGGEDVEVLRPGETLLLYTDGAIERRGSSIDDGLELLAQLASAAVRRSGGDPAALCRQLAAALVGDGPSMDDIAMLAVTRTG